MPWKWLNFFLEDDAKLEQVWVLLQGRASTAEKRPTPTHWQRMNTKQPGPVAPFYPAQIGLEYASGRMLTGEIKGELVSVLVEMVERHKAARELVTDDVVDAFMAVRPMDDLWG